MSFFLCCFLQAFSGVTLDPSSQPPGTLPPASWKGSEGRKSREKFWPKSHLTMYSHGGLWVKLTEAAEWAVYRFSKWKITTFNVSTWYLWHVSCIINLCNLLYCEMTHKLSWLSIWSRNSWEPNPDDHFKFSGADSGFIFVCYRQYHHYLCSISPVTIYRHSS